MASAAATSPSRRAFDEHTQPRALWIDERVENAYLGGA